MKFNSRFKKDKRISESQAFLSVNPFIVIFELKFPFVYDTIGIMFHVSTALLEFFGFSSYVS